MNNKNKSNGWALVPFVVFITIFLGSGLLLNDFYAISSPIAALVGVFVAFMMFRNPMNEKIDVFVKGCGDSKIITMCLIYLLAGAFTSVTKEIGAVDAMVNLGLSAIPLNYLALGVFIIAALLSTSIGTSVGSILALGPIVVGFSDVDMTMLPALCGALIGGAMFGDNLSFISDTTIASTQIMDCKMKDKFRVNIFIALPAAIVTIILLVIFSSTPNPDVQSVVVNESINFVLLVPYILVIVLAVIGLNVFSVLSIALVISGAIGIYYGNFSLIGYSKQIYSGFESMTEIFILSLLTGGLAAMVTQNGGVNFILKRISSVINSKKSAQLGIGALVGITNLAVANNTVSLIITSDIVKKISKKYLLDKRKVAALIDISSCVVQAIVPYGAQVLILLSFAKGKVDYFDILPYFWYIFLLLASSLCSIYFKSVDKRVMNIG